MPIWPVLTKIMSITRTPSGMVCTEGGSLGFDFSSCLRLNPPVAYGDSPPNSGALGMA